MSLAIALTDYVRYGRTKLFSHKTRFGQPETQMPALIETDVFTTQDAADIVFYSQSLPQQ